MRLSHITSVHSYRDTRIFIKECCSLARAGHEVHFIAPGAPHQKMNEVQLHTVSKIVGNRFIRMTKMSWAVYKKARSIDAEVYHFHDPELIPIGLLLKVQGKKVIYDVHEDVPRQILSKYWIPKPLRKMISGIFERFENFAARRFDAVVTATPHINQRFERLKCKAVNVNNYPILQELNMTERDWYQKERAVCYVGGISEIRGVLQMIEAVGKTDVQLLLAGQFTPIGLREKAIALQGWEQVVELGQINRAEVRDTLSRSIAGLVLFHPLPNHIDAQPNKMFEYMAAGIPVIASFFPLWKDIVEGNHCGVCVDPFNPEAIAEAIQWLVDHLEEAKKMGENGRKAVEEKYNWEQEAKKLISLYEEVGESNRNLTKMDKG